MSSCSDSTAGFFYRLEQHYDIRCPNIFMECKNYSRDPSNPEFDQLAMRLAPQKGLFGILVYRERANSALIRQRCRDIINSDKKFIIELDDEDIIKLLELRRRGGDKEIAEFLEGKLDAILL